MYTITSARYANADNTAIIAETQEVGTVAVSQSDAPDLFSEIQGAVTVAAFAPVISADEVKAEAERRILAIMPEHKQRNSLALGMEMSMEYGSDPANWPAAEQAIQTQVMTAWAAIKAIRAASNTLEAMDPIPADFRADSYWP